MVHIIQNVLFVGSPERGEQVLLGAVTGQPVDHDLRRKDLQAPSQKHGVFLTGIGIYTENTKDPEIIRIRKEISALALAHPYVEQVHGFYLDPEEKKIRFDTVVGFDAPDRMQVRDAIQSEASAKYPAYSIQVSLDTDFGMLHAPQPK